MLNFEQKLERTYPYIIAIIITCLFILFRYDLCNLNIFYNIHFGILFVASHLLFLLLRIILYLLQLKPQTKVYKNILIFGGYLIKSYFVELTASYLILNCNFIIIAILKILQSNNSIIFYIFIFVITLYIFCMIRCYCICCYFYKVKKIKDSMIIPPESEAEKRYKEKIKNQKMSN